MIEEKVAVQNHTQTITSSNKYQWDDWCFHCKGEGITNCCSNCTKTLHIQCQAKIRCLFPKTGFEFTSQNWICPYCENPSVCPVCNQIVENKSDSNLKFKCTLCCNLVHKECYHYGMNVKPQDDQKQIPLVCFQCFKLSGIRYIKQRKIIERNTYFLSQPYFSSHLHSGWLTFEQLPIITEQANKKKHKQNILKYVDAEEKNQFQQVLMVKPQRIEFINWADFINTKRNYEIRVLIKWKNQPLQKCSWENEFTLRKRNLLNKRIPIFLYKRWANQGMITLEKARQLIIQLYPENEIQNQNCVSTSFIQKIFQVKVVFTTILNIKNLHFLLTRLFQGPKYQKFNQKLPVRRILFVTQIPDIWKQFLTQHLPFLRISKLQSNTQQFNIQTDPSLFYESEPLFDVLLVKELKANSVNIFKKMNFDVFIIYKPQIQAQIQFSSTIFPQALKIFVFQDKQNYKNFASKISMIQLDTTMFIEDANSKQKISSQKNNSMQIQSCPNPILPQESKNTNDESENINKNNKQLTSKQSQKSKSKTTIQSLNTLQRLHFLRFVLQFGLEFSNTQQMYKKLVQFEQNKEIFVESQALYNATKKHLDEFLSSLVLNKHSPDLFEQWKCNDIIKRIASLSIIRKAYDYYKDQSWKIPLSVSFPFADKGKQRLYSQNWRYEDDVRLLQLIIQYGYNNWSTICQHFCAKLKNNGYQYLRNTIWPTLPKNQSWKKNIEFCIKVRSNMLMDSKEMQKVMQQK